MKRRRYSDHAGATAHIRKAVRPMTSRPLSRFARRSSFSLLLLTAAATIQAAAPHYQLTDLSAFGFTEVAALNNAGQVVGSNAVPTPAS